MPLPWSAAVGPAERLLCAAHEHQGHEYCHQDGSATPPRRGYPECNVRPCDHPGPAYVQCFQTPRELPRRRPARRPTDAAALHAHALGPGPATCSWRSAPTTRPPSPSRPAGAPRARRGAGRVGRRRRRSSPGPAHGGARRAPHLRHGEDALRESPPLPGPWCSARCAAPTPPRSRPRSPSWTMLPCSHASTGGAAAWRASPGATGARAGERRGGPAAEPGSPSASADHSQAPAAIKPAERPKMNGQSLYGRKAILKPVASRDSRQHEQRGDRDAVDPPRRPPCRHPPP